MASSTSSVMSVGASARVLVTAQQHVVVSRQVPVDHRLLAAPAEAQSGRRGYAALAGVEQAAQEVDEGGLAGAVRADQGNERTGAQRGADAPEGPLPVAVPLAKVIDLDLHRSPTNAHTRNRRLRANKF